MCNWRRTRLRTGDTAKITANDLEGTPDKPAIIFKPNLKAVVVGKTFSTVGSGIHPTLSS